MKFIISVALIFSIVMLLVTVPSEILYAQFLPTFPPNINIMSKREHVSAPITAAGNDESPIQSNC
jgi:hypothetical protein